MPRSEQEFYAELDKLTVAQVRANLATNVYLGHENALALLWLERRKEASSAEQIELARSAIRQAKKTNNIALIALAVAIISLIVSILPLVITRHW